MKKLLYALVLASLLILAFGGAALAQEGVPEGAVGACPTGFHFHMIGDHHGEHEHQHAGLHSDPNGDGWTCVKHVTPTGQVHVHVDNNRPLR